MASEAAYREAARRAHTLLAMFFVHFIWSKPIPHVVENGSIVSSIDIAQSEGMKPYEILFR